MLLISVNETELVNLWASAMAITMFEFLVMCYMKSQKMRVMDTLANIFGLLYSKLTFSHYYYFYYYYYSIHFIGGVKKK